MKVLEAQKNLRDVELDSLFVQTSVSLVLALGGLDLVEVVLEVTAR